MASIDCPLVEIIPGKVSGAPLLKNTRLPVDALTGNYDALPQRGGYLRTTPSPKPWAVIPKLALMSSGRFYVIAPTINYRRNLEGSVRRRRTTQANPPPASA